MSDKDPDAFKSQLYPNIISGQGNQQTKNTNYQVRDDNYQYPVGIREGESARMQMFLEQQMPRQSHNSSLLNYYNEEESFRFDNSKRGIVNLHEQQNNQAKNVPLKLNIDISKQNQQQSQQPHSSTVDRQKTNANSDEAYQWGTQNLHPVEEKSIANNNLSLENDKSLLSLKNNSNDIHFTQELNIMDKSQEKKFSQQRISHQIWLTKFFVIISLIGKFKYHIKKPLIFRNPQLLAKNQLKVIGDKGAKGFDESDRNKKNKKSANSSKYKFIRKLKKKFLIYKKLAKVIWLPIISAFSRLSHKIKKICISLNIPVFNPVNPLVVSWDLLNMVLIFFYTLYISFNVAFESHLSLIYFENIGKSVFLINLLIQCNLAYYEKGIKISSRYLIIINFFKSSLVNEVLALLGVFQPNGNILQLLMFFKYSQFQKVVRKYKENNQFSLNVNLIFQVTVLLTEIIQLCHFLCCGWYLIGDHYLNNLQQKSWLTDIDRSSIQTLYIQSFYYCVISITTIGYGDITAKNDGERIFAICTALTASGFFAYTVNRMSSILDENNKASNQFRTQLNDINYYMHQRQVSNKLQDRARSYLEYVYREGYVNQEKVKSSLNQLNKSLVEQIEGDIYYRTLKKFDLFGKNLSKNFLQRTALKIKEMNYGKSWTLFNNIQLCSLVAPDEDIFLKGEASTPIIFFIQRGEVEIYADTNTDKYSNKGSSKSFQMLSKNQQFGINEFLLQEQVHTYSARSKGITQLHCLSSSDFFEIIQEFPKDREYIATMKDRIILHNSFIECSLYCFSCKSNRHLVGNCPFVQYVPQELKIFNNAIKTYKEFQKNFMRNKNRIKICSLKSRSEIEKTIIYMLDDNEILDWVSQDENDQNESLQVHQEEDSNMSNSLELNLNQDQWRKQLAQEEREFEKRVKLILDSKKQTSSEAKQQLIQESSSSQNIQDDNNQKQILLNIEGQVSQINNYKLSHQDKQQVSFFENIIDEKSALDNTIKNPFSQKSVEGGSQYTINLIQNQEKNNLQRNQSHKMSAKQKKKKRKTKLIIKDPQFIRQQSSYEDTNQDNRNDFNAQKSIIFEKRRSVPSFSTSNNQNSNLQNLLDDNEKMENYLSLVLNQAIPKKNSNILIDINNDQNKNQVKLNSKRISTCFPGNNNNNNNNSQLFQPTPEQIVSFVKQNFSLRKNEDFDAASEYTLYFPHNNLTNVLKQYNSHIKILQQPLRKGGTFKNKQTLSVVKRDAK